MTITKRLAATLAVILTSDGEAVVPVPATQSVTAEEFGELVRFVLEATVPGAGLEYQKVPSRDPGQLDLPL